MSSDEELKRSVRNAQRYLKELRERMAGKRGLAVERQLAEDIHRNLMIAQERLREEARAS